MARRQPPLGIDHHPHRMVAGAAPHRKLRVVVQHRARARPRPHRRARACDGCGGGPPRRRASARRRSSWRCGHRGSARDARWRRAAAAACRAAAHRARKAPPPRAPPAAPRPRAAGAPPRRHASSACHAIASASAMSARALLPVSLMSPPPSPPLVVNGAGAHSLPVMPHRGARGLYEFVRRPVALPGFAASGNARAARPFAPDTLNGKHELEPRSTHIHVTAA